ncbi:DUF1656 domain-containing protein [Roseicella frigidaeris]|uniref:DUF1656 domain-containing protein n=1 Tax=Roseicella frigidaeris TaxID=2230885 RepID=A0A327MFV5_9PROT|nr:DUF1656 domain-containing protein [Roseicella frigidaeris]RAI60943.1 DUF1656 domain-containing protein [Roseicella frigidaeris]
MMQDINIYGVFVPAFGLLALAACLVQAALRRLLTAIGFYRFVWHPPLFNLALYTCLLGTAVALIPVMPR